MKWLVRDIKKLDSLLFHCNTTLPLSTIMVGAQSLFIASVDSGRGLGGQLEVKDETGIELECDGMGYTSVIV